MKDKKEILSRIKEVNDNNTTRKDFTIIYAIIATAIFFIALKLICS